MEAIYPIHQQFNILFSKLLEVWILAYTKTRQYLLSRTKNGVNGNAITRWVGYFFRNIDVVPNMVYFRIRKSWFATFRPPIQPHIFLLVFCNSYLLFHRQIFLYYEGKKWNLIFTMLHENKMQKSIICETTFSSNNITWLEQSSRQKNPGARVVMDKK